MWPIFARIYLWWLCILLLLGLLVYASIDQLNRHRFRQHIHGQYLPALALIRDGYLRHDQTEGQTDWIELTAALTGINWQIEASSQPAPALGDLSWLEQSATVSAPLTGERVIRADIQDWEHLARGIGLLLLNDLSLTPTADREARLAALSQQLGLGMERVGWRNEPLDFVAQYDLERGQVVVEQDFGNDQFLVYVPAGAEQALKIGPFDQFEWLTARGMTFLVLALLLTTALALGGVLFPLQRRLTRITRAVDRIAEQGHPGTLPEQPNDALTEMWQHVSLMARRLIDLAEQSRQLNQAVSHDLKTPLSRMSFALEMMDATREPLVHELKSDTRELNLLIDELLMFHQLSQSRPDQDHYCFPQAELEGLLDSRLMSGARVETRLAWPGRARVAAHHWRRLCRNLIANATQYGRGRIRIELKPDRDRLHLCICDNGIGFSEDLRHQAFEPFVRGDSARNLNRQGHGMGLTLCSSIVRHYGGEVTLGRCELGGGKVELWLPILDVTPDAAAETAREVRL